MQQHHRYASHTHARRCRDSKGTSEGVAEQIPVWLRWAQYTCALKYGMNLNIMNEFGEDVIKDWPALQQAEVKVFISMNEINVDHGWIYAGVLLGIVLVVRLLSVWALARRAAAFF
mmetsp:Transcript_1741/g.1876  ORF Transcript_1741/g.1876 Transcript_1741/m.1876 type:complete len:116 (-) Transcript_1741:94-441(-)